LFEVQILYREPTYEMWTESGVRLPFVARYPRIQAQTHLEAVRIAQTRFQDAARQSRVQWQRHVVEVRVRPQP
jgi:hypothetical protein